MKSTLLNKLVLLLAFSLLAWGCDDSDDGPTGYESPLNQVYSGKAINKGRLPDLDLTYSDLALDGKNIEFKQTADLSANLRFESVFPGEDRVVIENVNLVKAAENHYDFRGNHTTAGGTSFAYAGSVTEDNMTLSLTEVKVPSNTLLSQGTWSMLPYAITETGSITNPDGSVTVVNDYSVAAALEWYYTDDNGNNRDILSGLTPLVTSLVSKILWLVLEEVTFHADGNVTATYAGLPDDLDIAGLLGSDMTDVVRAPTSVSPKNLIFYYVDPNGNVYIKPNTEMIVNTIMGNRADARADNYENEYEWILELYYQLNQWANTGIRFNLSTELLTPADTKTVQYNNVADYFLYIDQTEFRYIFPLLPMVGSLLDLDSLLEGVPMGNLLQGILDSVLTSADRTSKFSLGIFLQNGF